MTEQNTRQLLEALGYDGLQGSHDASIRDALGQLLLVRRAMPEIVAQALAAGTCACGEPSWITVNGFSRCRACWETALAPIAEVYDIARSAQEAKPVLLLGDAAGDSPSGTSE
jgi:hypothetical protein